MALSLIAKLSLMISILCVAIALIIPTVSAADDLSKTCKKPEARNSSLCKDYLNGTGEKKDDNSVINAIKTVIGVLSFAAGALAVIFVVYGGFKYVTSGGDSNRVTEAKNIILYALVGLVVAVIGRFIIIYVLNQVA